MGYRMVVRMVLPKLIPDSLHFSDLKSPAFFQYPSGPPALRRVAVDHRQHVELSIVADGDQGPRFPAAQAVPGAHPDFQGIFRKTQLFYDVLWASGGFW